MSLQTILLNSILIIFFTSQFLFGQTGGTIHGKIIDKNNAEVIIGANILIEGTSIGAASDLEGTYEIKGIPAGTYTLIISYISYAQSRIENVNVEADKKIKIDIALAPEAISVDSVIIVGDASLEYEAALLNQQRKSITISDGISREQIKKSPDATSAEFLQRVPSITLMEGKYIYVRGVSERYSSAQLNNTPLASSEPDKKDFAFDLIPSYLVENTIVEKSYSPDNPGDFAGGIVKINTIDFPSQTLFRFSYGTSYIPDVSTKSFSTYAGGDRDFLGIDDGTRDLPADFPEDMGNLNPSDDSVYNLAKSLLNNWQVIGSKAPINQAFGLAYGDKFSLFGQDFGIIASANYKTEHVNNDIVTRQVSGGDEFVFDYSGKGYSRNVDWGLLMNMTYKLSDFHKIGIKNTYSVNSDDDVVQLYGKQYDRSNEQNLTALRFVSRELYSGQFVGQSVFPSLNGLKTDYAISYSESYRNEPDYRRYTYARDIEASPDEPFRIVTSLLPNLREGGRFYSDLNEISRGYKLDFTWKFGTLNTKFGGLFDNRSRTFNSRVISVISQQTTNSEFYYYGIDSVFAPENFRRSAWSIGEYNDGTSDYTSSDENFGTYAMIEFPFSVLDQNFDLVVGARLENYNLRLTTMNIERSQEIRINKHSNDILPSASLIYRISDAMNFRLSYSNTVNRPQFREIAPFSYYDFENQTVVTGNPELVQAKITNYDMRFEMFPYIGELISASIFYKELVNPIEKIILVSDNNNLKSFANSSFAKNYGFEIEMRSSLRYITEMLSYFSFTGNYTRIESEIEETSQGLERTTRAMQGQSPYVINLSLNYYHPDWGSNFTFLFYRYGERLVEVASDLDDDYFEQAHSIFDFVYNQEIGQHFEVRLTAKNMFPSNMDIYEADTLIRSTSTNTKFSLAVTYKL